MLGKTLTTSMEAVVMIVASSLEVGKFDTLAEMADNLAAFVRQAAADAVSLYDVERGTFDRLLAMGQAAVDLFLQAQGDGDLGASVTTEAGTVLERSDTVVQRPLRTIFGEHTMQTYVYSQGSKKKIELRPIDARINLPQGKASYLLQEFSQLFCVEKAFRVGSKQFETVFRQRLSVDVLEDINHAMGDQAAQFLDCLPTPPVSAEGEFLILTGDGKGVPLVRPDAEQVPAFDKKERPGNRRMATLGCVYTVDAHVRTPEQIVAALFRDDSVPQPPNRPDPCFKRYRAYFANTDPASGKAIASAYFTWDWLAQEMTRRRQPGQPIICLMDGQPSLWEAAEALLEATGLNLDELRAAGELMDILDIIHVSGYVWKAAKAFHFHREHQEAFVQERLLRILRGEVAGVVTGMRRMATLKGLKGAALKAVTTACHYFQNNAARMRYHQYLRAGYPIATGVIEGACRHVIKDRMEQGGMRWTLAGAMAMLNVRAVLASSETEDFGSWRQAEEAKRVHPHRALVQNYKGFRA
jgi:hypothetical protein